MAKQRSQILFNVRTDSLPTAVAASERYPDRIVIGVTGQHFAVLAEGIALVRQMQENGVLVSVGLVERGVKGTKQ